MIDSQVEECSEDINGNEIIYKWSWKSMQFLYNIHNLINHNAITLVSIGSFD